MNFMDKRDRASMTRRLTRRLNSVFGLAGRVKVRFCRPSQLPAEFRGCLGYCLAPSERGIVHITISDERMAQATLVDTLIHEYAHAIVYHLNPRCRTAHGAQWGRAYAAVYRVAINDFPELDDESS